jgi:hypothetical protein
MAVTEDNSTLIIATSFASKLLALKITDGGDLVERRTFAEVAGTMDFGAAISPAGVVRTAHSAGEVPAGVPDGQHCGNQRSITRFNLLVVLPRIDRG